MLFMIKLSVGIMINYYKKYYITIIFIKNINHSYITRALYITRRADLDIKYTITRRELFTL